MPIEITGQTTNQLSKSQDDKKLHVIPDNNKSTPSEKETGDSSTLDKISLTDSAGLLQKIEAAIGDAPVVDTQRVEDIRRAIATGNFEIDATRVAEKMLGFESRLNSKS